MAKAPGQFDKIDRDQEMASLKPGEVLGKLDLAGKGLEAVRKAATAKDEDGAFRALVEHYRRRYPLEPAGTKNPAALERADKICRHVLQWGPYEEADYGPEFDWEWDPRGDIEWVAAVYRFYWAGPLAEAYRQTGDEKYAQAFVDLTSDWMSKHPLEKRKRIHPVYTHWKGFVWLDIQTGIRATNICFAFKTLVHGKACTGDFLRRLLACLYDHQVKTKLIPMGLVHNKAVFEQRGFINVAYHFREFRESREWMEIAMDRARENFLLQTTADGVQREWSFGYHTGVLRDAVEIQGRMDEMGIPVPEDYKERIRRMHDYILAVATPDLGAPMFGDGSRPIRETDDRTKWPLYGALVEATALLGDPKYEARAKNDSARLPKETSCAFKDAGMYVMRDQFGPDGIHLGLHCSPKAISGHDQPDNGTFELCAYGRWLMPDTGFYTYGHDAEGRKWHRQTRVHQTFTLDGADILDDGRHLLWQDDGAGVTLVVENGSYVRQTEILTHRRTVWFVDRRYFVFLDEAIGTLPGRLDLHFQFAPGEVTFDAKGLRAYTVFEDAATPVGAEANVLVAASEGARLKLEEEEGWFAWAYGHRKPRKAFRFEHSAAVPATFLTAVIPYRGKVVPMANVRIDGAFAPGDAKAQVVLEVGGSRWRVGRDLAAGKAWMEQ